MENQQQNQQQQQQQPPMDSQQQQNFNMGSDPNQQFMMGGYGGMMAGGVPNMDPNMMMQMGYSSSQYGGYPQQQMPGQYMQGYGMPMQGYGQQMGGNSAYSSKSHFKSGQANDPAKYKTVMCRHFQSQGACTLGDKCSFAHGEAELRKSPGVYQQRSFGSDNQGGRGGFGGRGGRGGHRGGFQGGYQNQQSNATYKTAICKNFENGNCKYGDKCSFAHGEHELKKSNSAPNQKFNLQPPPLPGLAGFPAVGGMPPVPQVGMPYGMPQYGGVQQQPQLNMQAQVQQTPQTQQQQTGAPGEFPPLGGPDSQ